MNIFKTSSPINFNKIKNTYFSNNSKLRGNVTVPGDKSISQRSLIISLISVGTTTVKDILDSEDVFHTLKAIEELGAKIKKVNNSLEIKGVGLGNLLSPKKPIYMGNSGTGARLLLGLVAGSNACVTFYGDDSLSNRPMDRIITPLEEMGATIISAENKKLPITIIGARSKGFVLPINYKLLIPSAQVKSAIILAAVSARGTSFITECEKTRNYTERMLKQRGVCITQKKINTNKSIISLDGASMIKSKNIKIPGDPSSAVFMAVAALITKKSSITIKNVLNDKFRLSIFRVLKQMGARISFLEKKNDVCDIIIKSSVLKSIIIKSNKSSSLIDEYPILSIAAACAKGETIMEGLGELRFKESDRFKAIIDGLSKCGVFINGYKDTILIKGMKKIPGGCFINALNDHRIAMSFNILNLVAEKPILITGNKSIMTSFPNFFNSLISLGAISLSYDRRKN